VYFTAGTRFLLCSCFHLRPRHSIVFLVSSQVRRVFYSRKFMLDVIMCTCMSL